MLRDPEPGMNNLGEFVADNAIGLAQVLGVSPRDLLAAREVDDEKLAPRLRHLLERARDRVQTEDVERRRQRAINAAVRLGETARRTDLGFELDADLLLTEMLVNRSSRWIRFQQDGGIDVHIPKALIVRTAPLRRLHVDLAAFVDAHGLHFRWRGGRGGYNWRSHEPRHVDPYEVLTVPLSPTAIVEVPERRRGGAWLGHILRDLGWPA